MSRITTLISALKEEEVFVFGSNESGRHGKGAAKTALKWGAKRGVGEGLSGQTYAIPTKDTKVITLSLNKIRKYIARFIEFARENSDSTFLVTEIGCGLAGYSAEDIAPFFSDAIDMENVHMPDSFWKVLGSVSKIVSVESNIITKY